MASLEKQLLGTDGCGVETKGRPFHDETRTWSHSLWRTTMDISLTSLSDNSSACKAVKTIHHVRGHGESKDGSCSRDALV